MAKWLNSFYGDKVLSILHEQLREHKNAALQNFLTAGNVSLGSRKKKYAPLHHSYQVGKVPAFVHSKEFAQLLSKIAGFTGTIKDVEACVFSQGDYSVLADAQKPGRGVLFLLSVNPGVRWNDEWGGFVSILEGSQEVMRVSPQENALTIINYQGLRSFVKYVNHHAKSSFVLIRGFLVPK